MSASVNPKSENEQSPMSDGHTPEMGAPGENVRPEDETVRPESVISIDSLMITRATSAHLPYLRRLKERVMRDRYRPAPDEEGFLKWKEQYCTDEYFEQIIDNPDSMLLSIGTLRDPVGMVALRREQGQLEIDDLLVMQPRIGAGTRLLLAALRYAEAWRYRKVFIDVYPGHSSVEDFLRTHGFSFDEVVSNNLGRPMHRFGRTLNF